MQRPYRRIRHSLAMNHMNPQAGRSASSAIRLAVLTAFSSAAWSQVADSVVAQQLSADPSGAPARQLGTVVVTGGRPTSLP